MKRTVTEKCDRRMQGHDPVRGSKPRGHSEETRFFWAFMFSVVRMLLPVSMGRSALQCGSYHQPKRREGKGESDLPALFFQKPMSQIWR
jgi:hypothetical protein